MEQVRNVLNFLKLILMFITDFTFHYIGHNKIRITEVINRTQFEY